jgi:nitric oxide reductase NorD protein
MAEAEDVIVDAAKHATSFLQSQWRRRRPELAPPSLAEHAQRLEHLVAAAFGRALKIRPAQPPAPATLLRKIFQREKQPAKALPATDGRSIWLPETLDVQDDDEALARYRLMALRQGMRAVRGSADVDFPSAPPAVQDAYLLLEAAAADDALARLFPGTRAALRVLARPRGVPDRITASAQESLELARVLATEDTRLLKDEWTGELRVPSAAAPARNSLEKEEQKGRPAKSARLARTPKVREPVPGEDEGKPGPWMVQSSQPNEHVEDPMGLQRPTDRDEQSAAEELAESVADLPEARLVTRPGTPKEVLLSAESPARRAFAEPAPAQGGIAYPEWDYRLGEYRRPGAVVRLTTAEPGNPAWIRETLERHAGLVGGIRRRFEALRARRTRLRRQLDGEEIDLDACVESMADWIAGLPRSERLYQTLPPARRDMALGLLVDISGSTDSWVSGTRRTIDVEREALLLVCIALEALGERYTVQAFSGEGPGAVTVRALKGFEERYGDEVARRIAALEPDRYTRAGAALRHVTALLMRETARHRLLLLLSDGKPNDIDEYEGRYGVEDMRQAVLEARLQGIETFCLTVDRAAPAYLPAIFGARDYALLPRPELLPTALIDWIRRLASS